MQKTWNNCTKIYEDGEFITDVDMDMFNAYNRYINIIHHEPKLDVWHDADEDVCFGPEQDFYKNSGEFSFFSQKENFINDSRWGKQHLLNLFEKSFGSNLLETDEYMIQDYEGFKKFEGKTILLIGGGPSTNDIDWTNLNFDYDYAWSCNNFFMNPKMEKVKMSLVALSPTVDLEDERLINYVKKHNTICTFEGGISPFREHSALSKFKEHFPDQVAYFHLRYFSKLGTMNRLACLAKFLKAKKIYLVGMDGYSITQGLDYDHAFEDRDLKKINNSGRIFSYHLHKRLYVLFWEYLLNTLEGGNVEYQNLGENHSANQFADISKKEFALQI